MDSQGFRNIVPMIGKRLDYTSFMRLRHTSSKLFRILRRHSDINDNTYRDPRLVAEYFDRYLLRFIRYGNMTLFGYEKDFCTFTVCKVHRRTGIICDLLGTPRSDIFRDDFMHCFDDNRRLQCLRSLSNEERERIKKYKQVL